jgi:hypothetical protein
MRDYTVGVIPNHKGQLCSSYPLELVIILKEKETTVELSNSSVSSRIQAVHKDRALLKCMFSWVFIDTCLCVGVEPVNDCNRLETLFKLARFSRVRARFPIPVLLFNGYAFLSLSLSPLSSLLSFLSLLYLLLDEKRVHTLPVCL